MVSQRIGEFGGCVWIPLKKNKDPKGPAVWSFSAVGDYCPWNIHQQFPLISNNLSQIIKSNLVNIINLEGPIFGTEKNIIKAGINLILKKDSIKHVKEMGFNVLTLANNHILDYGISGMTHTITEIEKSGLYYCGAGKNLDYALKPANIIIKPGIKLSVFNFAENYLGVADNENSGIAWFGAPEVIQTIYTAKKSGKVIVICVHCNIEDVPIPPIQLQNKLRQFVNAGADIIIATHPHVPQGFEKWGNGIIFYSLGNFSFASESGYKTPKRDVSIMIQAFVDGRELVGCKVIPLEQFQGDIRLMSENENRDVKEFLNYLLLLEEILTNPFKMKQCWQELAVFLFYQRYLNQLLGLNILREELDYYSINIKIKQSIEILKQFIYLWVPLYTRLFARKISRVLRQIGIFKRKNNKDKMFCFNQKICNGKIPNSILQKVLGAFVTIRSGSDRWTVETALSVLTGDIQDSRNKDSSKLMNKLLKQSSNVFKPDYIPFILKNFNNEKTE